MKSYLKYLFFVTLMLAFFFSCKKNNNEVVEKETQTPKRQYYLDLMKEKNFSLSVIGDCDEDAFDDTTHSHGFAYIDSELILDSLVVIDFKFIESCCKEFLGDYKINNDTLFFEYEQVNEKFCPCYCWYKYKLSVKNFESKISHIKISSKMDK